MMRIGDNGGDPWKVARARQGLACSGSAAETNLQKNLPHPSTSEIGVGMAVADHPSLRTGLADFPHPALQSVSHPLVAGLVRLARAKAYREISPSFSKNALG